MLFQALCIISYPSVNSNSSYNPETPNLGQNRLFFAQCDLEIWWMTLKSNRAPFLCYFKLCASFHNHQWIQTRVRVQKRPIWVKICFFSPCDLEIRRMTLKKNMAPLLCYFKLCASFQSHRCIQTRVTVRKNHQIGAKFLTSVTLTFDLWPWPFAWTSLLSMLITPRKLHDDTMSETSWKRCHRQTDGQTERSVLRAAWSQLKILALDHSSTAEST